MANLLDVWYFHVVFTVPHELNPLICRNQRKLYNLLFRAVAETLQELAKDGKVTFKWRDYRDSSKQKKLKLCKLLTVTKLITKMKVATEDLIEKLIGRKRSYFPHSACNQSAVSFNDSYPTFGGVASVMLPLFCAKAPITCYSFYDA